MINSKLDGTLSFPRSESAQIEREKLVNTTIACFKIEAVSIEAEILVLDLKGTSISDQVPQRVHGEAELAGNLEELVSIYDKFRE